MWWNGELRKRIEGPVLILVLGDDGVVEWFLYGEHDELRLDPCFGG